MTGLLLLVIGPSGVGKDTLLIGAAGELAGHSGLRFVRRIITRPPQPGGEQNEAVDEATFLRRLAGHGFALDWQAHGLRYGIPADIEQDLAAGRDVIASVSRTVLAQAAARFPVHLIEITAPAALRATRLVARGREDIVDIAARLAREIPAEAGPDRSVVRNDGSVAEGVAALRDILLAHAAHNQGSEP